MSLNRKDRSALVEIFSGLKATEPMEIEAPVDTVSPATFIQYPVWKKMVDVGAAPIEGARAIDPVSRGGFDSVPLYMSLQVRLNIRLWPRRPKPRHSVQNGKASLVVQAHVAPEVRTTHDIIMGRDGLGIFSVRTYNDVNKQETIMTVQACPLRCWFCRIGIDLRAGDGGL